LFPSAEELLRAHLAGLKELVYEDGEIEGLGEGVGRAFIVPERC
jgi:hypothetical protein